MSYVEELRDEIDELLEKFKNSQAVIGERNGKIAMLEQQLAASQAKVERMIEYMAEAGECFDRQGDCKFGHCIPCLSAHFDKVPEFDFTVTLDVTIGCFAREDDE